MLPFYRDISLRKLFCFDTSHDYLHLFIENAALVRVWGNGNKK